MQVQMSSTQEALTVDQNPEQGMAGSLWRGEVADGPGPDDPFHPKWMEGWSQEEIGA